MSRSAGLRVLQISLIIVGVAMLVAGVPLLLGGLVTLLGRTLQNQWSAVGSAAVWTLIGGAMLLLFVAVAVAEQRIAATLRDRRRLRCRACGYDLHLHASSRCPECGADVLHPGATTMRMLIGTMVLLAAGGLAGCQSMDPTKAVRVDAFDPLGDTSTELTRDMAEAAAENGVVVHFKEGDEIVVELGDVQSDLVERVGPNMLRVKQSFHLFAAPNGILLSLDGEDFKRRSVGGAVSFGMQIDSRDRRNRMAIDVEERVRD